MELEQLFYSDKGVCCKCGIKLYSANGALGDYFVMDNDGNYYCCDCDDIFDIVDDRIYVPERDRND